ncbi:MAG: hypothetical protein AAF568_00370 [Pseudomonadota bacterium]
MVGYGIGALMGVLMAAAFGGGFTGAISGVLVGWLGGALATLLVAYGWHKGLWLQKWCEAPLEERQQEAELARWDADLTYEEIETALKEEPAPQRKAG